MACCLFSCSCSSLWGLCFQARNASASGVPFSRSGSSEAHVLDGVCLCGQLCRRVGQRPELVSGGGNSDLVSPATDPRQADGAGVFLRTCPRHVQICRVLVVFCSLCFVLLLDGSQFDLVVSAQQQFLQKLTSRLCDSPLCAGAHGRWSAGCVYDGSPDHPLLVSAWPFLSLSLFLSFVAFFGFLQRTSALRARDLVFCAPLCMGYDPTPNVLLLVCFFSSISYLLH